MVETSLEQALAMAHGIARAVNTLTARGHTVEWDVDAGRYRVDGAIVSDAGLLDMAATLGSGRPVQ